MIDVGASFIGSIPDFYDKCLGPAWFDAFAEDLASRLPSRPAGDVLELACGTGLVTRRMRDRLDSSIKLFATDISKPMLDYARSKLDGREGIEWGEADAADLPFADRQFGAVVCAFGVMFVPDKLRAFREARRVLRPGGTYLFNVWDRIEANPHAAANVKALSKLFPEDRELSSTSPYEMHDRRLLETLLTQAGFQEARIAGKRVQVEGVSARTIALGHIRGSPRALALEKRGVSVDEIVDLVAKEMAEVGGDPYVASVQAVVVQAL